jgi:hypothetical protein
MVKDELSGHGLEVGAVSAGDFYRDVTAEVLRELGWTEGVPPKYNEDTLTRVVDAVTARPGIYEDQNWRSLAKPVEALVSTIGGHASAQRAGAQWHDRVVEAAIEAEKDALVIDGRNPRDRIADFIYSGQVVSALDLMLHCDVEEAARRALRREHGQQFQPTPEAIQERAVIVAERRRKDAQRQDRPFVTPAEDERIDYRPPLMTPHAATVLSRTEARDPQFPLTIYFDTTRLPFEPMKGHITGLAGAAVEVPLSRAKLVSK